MVTHAPANPGSRHWGITLAVTTSESTTDVIDKSDYTCGSFDVPSGSSITVLTWYGAAFGTPLAASDQDGVAITQAVAASGHYELPHALAGSKTIYAKGDAAGTIYVNLMRGA